MSFGVPGISGAPTAERFIDPGRLGVGYLYLTGVVADGETVTTGSRKYEFEVVNTDTTVNITAGEANNTTDPLTFAMAAHSKVVGDLLRLENEIMRVTVVPDAGNLTVARGVSGTTTAAHAGTPDIYGGDGVENSGDVLVGLVADLTADAAAAALTADINGDTSRTVRAAEDVTGGNDNIASTVMFLEDTVGGSNMAISETCGNGVVSAASLQGASLPIARKLLMGLYIVTAADVTTFAAGRAIIIGGLPVTASPTTGSAQVFTPSTGSRVAIEGFAPVQLDSNFWAMWLFDTGAALSAADIVYFSVWVEA